MRRCCKEKVAKGKLKAPISLPALCFLPQSGATRCLFASPSFLVCSGPRLGDGLEMTVDSHWWRHCEQHPALSPLLSYSQPGMQELLEALLSQPVPPHNPPSLCFPRRLQKLLPSGESPANPNEATIPCVIQSCLPLCSCPSSLAPGLPLPTPTPQDPRKVLSPPGLCPCHFFFLKYSSIFSQLTTHPQVSLPGAFSWTPWVWMRCPSPVSSEHSF